MKITERIRQTFETFVYWLKKAHTKKFKWEVLTAVSTAVLAVLTVFLVGTAIYIPLFSDLPSRLAEIAELTTTNRKLSDHALRAQIQANNAIVQSLSAQAEINRSLQVSLSALQRAQDLADKARNMEAKVNDLTAEKKILDTQKMQITGDLKAANQTLAKTVDASANIMYSGRFADFLSQMRKANVILIPTIPTDADVTSGKTRSYGFVLMEKHFFNSMKQDAMSAGYVYDAGELAIMAFEQHVSTVVDGGGVSFITKPIPVNDDCFKKFILLLKSKCAIDVVSLFYLKNSIDIDPLKPGPDIRVIDVLSKIAVGKKAFVIGFLPGNIDDVSYEDFKIRGFWFSGVGNALVLAGGLGDQLKNKMKGFELSSNIKETGLSMQFSQKEIDETTARSKAVFGEAGSLHLRERLKHLDEKWLKELRTEPLQLGNEPIFLFDSDEHLSKIYQRWNWNDSLEQQSVVLFNSIVTEERLNFALMCSAARFLDNNDVSRGPDVLSSLNTCKVALASQDKVDEFFSKYRSDDGRSK